MDEMQTKTMLPQASAPGAPSIMLVAFHEDRVRVLPLSQGRPAIVGRARGADLTLEDDTISREHTRFEVDEVGVWVEDLRSKNGTLLNGRAISRARVNAGDKVSVGAATLSIHIDAQRAQQIAGVEAYEDFFATLSERLTRARKGDELALAVIRNAATGARDSQWIRAIVPLTGPYDRLATDTESEALVLLESGGARDVEAFQRALVKSVGEDDLRCGVAHFPHAARNAEALLRLAREAADRATSDAPIQHASSAPRYESIGGEPLVVSSPEMQDLYATVRQVAKSPIPVLIVGDTGTGKELVARAIHEQSTRRGRMLCVNCAAIAESLIESELFGHERGAFTGADRQAKGVFEEANGGSVFLDEVGELSPAGQAALLRVLETKRFSRVGSKRELAVDVRIIAATNRDLDAMSEAGTFRADLLYRINTMVLEIPALHHRRDEIAPLARYFVQRASEESEEAPKAIAPEVLALLLDHTWPGNVRELRNVIERGAALASSGTIEIQHLPPHLLRAAARHKAPPRHQLDTVLEGPKGPGATSFRDFIARTEASMIASAASAVGWKKVATAEQLGIPLRTLNDKVRLFRLDASYELDDTLLAAIDEAIPASVSANFRDRIRRYEASIIGWALEACGGHKSDAAKRIGIPARTLRDKIRTSGMS